MDQARIFAKDCIIYLYRVSAHGILSLGPHLHGTDWNDGQGHLPTQPFT